MLLWRIKLFRRAHRMSLSTLPHAILLLTNHAQLTWTYGVRTLYADHFLLHSLLIAIGGAHVLSFQTVVATLAEVYAAFMGKCMVRCLTIDTRGLTRSPNHFFHIKLNLFSFFWV
jgi:hypothetical protein